MVRILEPMLELLDHSEQKKSTEDGKNNQQPFLECIELIDDCSDGAYSIKYSPLPCKM